MAFRKRPKRLVNTSGVYRVLTAGTDSNFWEGEK
jgi:hypothetical protein